MKNILVARTDGIGDLLCATPLFKALKEGGNRVCALVSGYAAPVIENCAWVDEIILYGGAKEKMLRAKKFDAVIAAYPRFEQGLLFMRAGIPERYGTAYRWYSGLVFNKRIKMHRKENAMHEADYNLKLAEEITGAVKAEKVYMSLTGEERNAAAAFLERGGLKEFMMVYPGGKDRENNLSPAQYGDFAVRAAAASGMKVLAAAGPGEDDRIEGVLAAPGAKDAVSVIDKMPGIRELAAIIERSALFVSGSTGPMHIAAALDVPTLSFFPSSGLSPVRWKPLGNVSEIIMPASGAGMGATDIELAVSKAAEMAAR